MHYMRMKRHGSPDMHGTPRGGAGIFLQEALKATHNKCIPWPYAKREFGYGAIRVDGRTARVNRYACQLAHGDPQPGEEAAHSCGNRACINPQHLRWATRVENQMDRVAHGTSNRGERQWLSKLTSSDVLAIRAAVKSKRLSQRKIAIQFEVGVKTVNDIARGKTWAWLP